MKTLRNQPKRNSILKANIKATNRMNMKCQYNGDHQQIGDCTQTMLNSQSSQNSQMNVQHFWLYRFFKQVRFLLKQIASNSIIYDENHIECFNDLAKISVWKEIAHDFKGLSLQSK